MKMAQTTHYNRWTRVPKIRPVQSSSLAPTSGWGRSTFGLQQTRRENHKKRKSRYFGGSELLVVKNGVCPGPKKLPRSVNGNYGHSTQLGDGKGPWAFFGCVSADSTFKWTEWKPGTKWRKHCCQVLKETADWKSSLKQLMTGNIYITLILTWLDEQEHLVGQRSS